MAKRVGINGFGRIGRNFYRASLDKDPGFEIVAVNDLAAPDVLAHLLRYDSTHGRLDNEVDVSDGEISVDGNSFRVLAERDPSALPWKDMEVDVVVESTGLFTNREGASQHLTAGADKVVISAPATDPDITLVLGVNDDAYDPEKHHVISNASCTTNSVGPMAKILRDSFGIKQGFMTTVHAYTTEQQLQDQVAVTRKGKVDGMALRVPVPDGSITDLVCVLERPATAAEVNEAFRSAAASDHWAGILQYTEDPIVSSDIVGNPYSCILDGLSTMAHGDRVKTLGWYDNEWGYSCRCVDLIDRLL